MYQRVCDGCGGVMPSGPMLLVTITSPTEMYDEEARFDLCGPACLVTSIHKVIRPRWDELIAKPGESGLKLSAAPAT